MTLNLKYLALINLYELQFLWNKFVVIWRIPRTWALFDDIESPENMNRCMMNNNCFEGFWRGWHRGFNVKFELNIIYNLILFIIKQWLIRYIFVPLGGSKFKLFNIWAVFTYVALWHDFDLNLLIWAWFVCFALISEIMIKGFFNSKKIMWIWKTYWFKYVCAFTTAF